MKVLTFNRYLALRFLWASSNDANKSLCFPVTHGTMIRWIICSPKSKTSASRRSPLWRCACVRARSTSSWGRTQAVGLGSWLRNAIEQDSLSSVILFGPAGTGKTSLAHVIAETTKATFVEVSAIGGTVSDLRREIDAADKRLRHGRLAHHPVRRRDPPLQPQPAGCAAPRRGGPRARAGGRHHGEPLLRGELGAHQPFARCGAARAVRRATSASCVDRAVADERGLGGRYRLDARARDAIVLLAGGDGRAALTTLELAAGMVEPGTAKKPARDHRGQRARRHAAPLAALRQEQGYALRHHLGVHQVHARQRPRCRAVLARPHDRRGRGPEVHRAPHVHRSHRRTSATPIRRRCSSPRPRSNRPRSSAIPECRINLAQAAIYLALAPKSNAAEAGIDAALAEVRNGPARNVPDHLRDRHRPGSESYGDVHATRTAIPAAGSTSATCPTALSAARSTARATAAGRRTAPMRPHATVMEGGNGQNPTSRSKVTDRLPPV